ncbi:hypothetical protein AAFF_G00420000 [Aldrovandia affinis]|uniref:Secreted protein n=1 Tax=Aldrovandia affinis TaxID=143900 RepID=A0AAD7WJ77_9TELE|nr:hypothetical protein AAFF_G00420000 [Aldrovandia affinis]
MALSVLHWIELCVPLLALEDAPFSEDEEMEGARQPLNTFDRCDPNFLSRCGHILFQGQRSELRRLQSGVSQQRHGNRAIRNGFGEETNEIVACGRIGINGQFHRGGLHACEMT